jgi:hypothetical protein
MWTAKIWTISIVWIENWTTSIVWINAYQYWWLWFNFSIDFGGYGCGIRVFEWFLAFNYFKYTYLNTKTSGMVGENLVHNRANELLVGKSVWCRIVGWEKQVGRECNDGRQIKCRSGKIFKYRQTVGRQIFVGRERPLPTGLTVTDKIGGRNWFATNFVSVNVAFPTNLYVGFLVLWCSERGISDPWILLKSNFGAIFFSKRATPFHYCNITEINEFN